MAITFNTSAIDGGIAVTGVYAHIWSVNGPNKVDAIAGVSEVRDSDGIITRYGVAAVPESWFLTYGVVLHKDAATRTADQSSWGDRIPSRVIDRFKWTAANLDTYPTMAVLYGDLKVKLAGTVWIKDVETVIATSIADA